LVTPEKLAVARAHGDLNPENILVDGERVGLLDFTMIKFAPRLLDPTHLYMCFELMRWRPWFRPALLRRLQSRLLAEYDPALAPDDPLFELLTLQHAVARLTGLPDTVTTTAAAIRRWVLRRRELACRSLIPLPSR
jgi:aminoglycoside phosphotransferase (APT) family kinase protein